MNLSPMPPFAIKVENLSKSYLIGHRTGQSERYTALRDVIAKNARNFARKTRDMLHGKSIIQGDEIEEFWALRNVSFEIKQGDRVGIIGRNGAGKSTLLKILSRITEPTSGRIEIKGRVASLLEVGTGFHPELTGRENVFLNGAILGMDRKEIQRKFDEIITFAEIEKFLDTPVKRYSSGMYVRLAFAVAAHLEPEILIVDEVLAVGDMQFQKKCMGKMKEAGKDGRTVLFVSHNLATINSLCDSSILLSGGKIAAKGMIGEVIVNYKSELENSLKSNNGQWRKKEQTPGIKNVRIKQFSVITNTIVCGEQFIIEIEIELSPDCHSPEIGFGFIDENGGDIIRVNNKHLHKQIFWPKSGSKTVTISVPHLNWIEGEHVYLGVYFGYIGDRYEEYPQIIKLNLAKKFGSSSCDGIITRVNKIFIDGIEFN